MKTQRYAIIGAALACAVATFAWFSSVSGTVSQESEVEASPIPRPIPTAIVQELSPQKVRMFPGTVKARKSADLGFSVDGLLVELNGQEGRPVKKGDILARIDQRDFQNNYQASRANYLRASADFKRADALFKRNVISQAEYDQARSANDVALAEMKIRKKGLDDTVLTAPYDAIIARRYVENNEHVKKQTAILALKDISEIEVVIEVPERLMAHDAARDFADIWVNFDADRNRWFAAGIKEYSVESDPVTRTYNLSVALHSPADMEVLPGMTATVRTVFTPGSALSPISAVAIVPVEAIFSTGDGNSYAWIIPEQGGKPTRQPVVVGAIRSSTIEVVEGLEPGTRIATAGVHSLSEEMVVRPMKAGGEGLDG